MALPRKGSRRIVVEGVAYRWFGTWDALRVQHEEQPGALLIVPLGRTWLAPPPMPSEVADLIRQGLQRGWRPTEAGPALTLPQPPLPQFQPRGREDPRVPDEVAWLVVTDPVWMLARLGVEPHERKALLTMAASCRLAWETLPGAVREWVVYLEELADSDTDHREVYHRDWAASVESVIRERIATAPPGPLRQLLFVIRDIAERTWWTGVGYDGAPEGEAQRAQVAHLVRDVFGNPFQEEAILRRSGLNRTIRAIAETIYAERQFADLPILADALEDAGCADAPILAHLREPGPHVRGCWALDRVLRED
jgi:hypothetical protein